MSDTDQEELERVIAENPETVARFVDHLDAVNELLDVVELGGDALDDEMVASLAGTATTLAEAGDGLATDETVRLADTVGENADDLNDALESLLALQRSGTLADLVAVADVVALGADAMDDEMVSSLAATGSSLGEVADEASDPDTVRGMRTLLRAMGHAGDSDVDYAPVGAVGLLRALRDPEVKHGMAFLVGLARGIGREIDETA
ncbi:DUF1641 domain-containing protein [Haloplanus aerogenes]|uniref:DUF1641 domain-containing protein n=1 Tax=Haloplanus aerogenes TaxID=660522 RepID=A0A3M0DBD8_9EURY|nr:DUF1641 domain-containing protein [Haloplanus aerogenes]AZH23934.1 DUF1641 domain-containing protein [Haloplanus aerogenes]RMB13303.1 uncharacterized protein YjgD (DUF1641 family) [Haloplanus aerogenes]